MQSTGKSQGHNTIPITKATSDTTNRNNNLYPPSRIIRSALNVTPSAIPTLPLLLLLLLLLETVDLVIEEVDRANKVEVLNGMIDVEVVNGVVIVDVFIEKVDRANKVEVLNGVIDVEVIDRVLIVDVVVDIAVCVSVAAASDVESLDDSAK